MSSFAKRAVSPFTPQERDLIRLEMGMRFGQYPELANGLFLRTWHSGVHHRSSLVVEVDTAGGVVAISDSFFVYENIEGGIPLGLNESFEEMLATNARVLRTASHIVPLYDPAVFERYPGGVIAAAPADG